jgi:hypothetical protein
MSNAESSLPGGNNDALPEESNKISPNHHLSKILHDALDQSVESDAVAHGDEATKPRNHKHPIVIDVVLACGLIVAVGGFTVGLLHMYVDHLAEQSLKRNDYSAAVALMDGMPQIFMGTDSESRELFDRAVYLDATRKLNLNPNDQFALSELNRIMPGSQFFDSSQEVLTEHFKPASVTLTCSASKNDQISPAELAKMKAEEQTARTADDY